MTPRTKPPFPPRHDSLTEQAELGPDGVPDDALVERLAVESLALEWHSSEFVEWGASTVAGGTAANSDWFKPSWYDLSLTGVDLANARLTEPGLRRLAFTDCRMTGFDIAQSVVQDATFTGCLLDLANLRFAKLTRVRFVDCRLRGADLSSAQLVDVTFEGCDLSEVQFHELRTTRGAIRGSQLTGAKSIAGLRGMVIDPVDLLELTHQLAAELGIRIE
ncbi:pentapeptide repeat-containing protein [Aestuariimicrobium soli]|uniref:pentapeptide repeat-containing protein n=1 Tax=Aestuariimicrobium soli TaxID=2035834 RepID=UPI003EB80898